MKKIFTLVSKSKTHVLLICFLVIATASFSQTASQYTFSTAGNGSLALDRNGNTVDMSTGTTLLVDKGIDDGVGSASIGFDFAFMSTGGTNNVFNQFSASSNGVIRLGTAAVSSTLYGNAFPVSGQAVIAPYLQDQETNTATGSNGANGKVHYKLIGSYPNRTLVVEFLNMRINYNSSSANATYQVRLYEQTNVIEFVYGAMSVGSASTTNASSTSAARNVTIGFCNSNTTNNVFSVSQSSPYTTSTSTTSIVNTNSSTGAIAGLNSTADGSRRVFAFTPTVDFKSQFLSMNTGSTTWCAGETRTITVRVKNIGTQPWTSGGSGVNFSYWWSNQNQDFNPRLQPFTTSVTSGQEQTVSFTATAPSTGGTFTLNFDLVKEGACWFRDNVAGCSGPGNILYTSPSQTINTPASITGQPSDQSTCAGTAKTFTVTATGASPTYQWQYSADGSSNWNNVVNGTPTNINYTNATTASLTVTPAGATAGATYYYRCLVSVSGCSTPTPSNAASLLIYGAPSNANAGADQTICTTATSTALAATAPAVGSGVWSMVSGPSTASTQFSNTTNPAATFTPSGGAGVYTIRWTVSNGSCAIKTDDAIITVNTPATISSATGDQATCAGTAKQFGVTAAGTGLIYTWQYSLTGAANSFSNVVNGTPANIIYTNAATATLTVTPASGAANSISYYRCVVTTTGCETSSPISAPAKLTVSATPTTSNAGPDQAICSTTANTPLAANAPANGNGSWSAVSGPSTASTQFSSTTNPAAAFAPAGGAGTYTLRWTISNGACTISTDDIIITVNAAPSVTGQASNQTNCAGTAKTFTITATGTNPTYQWQYSADGSTNWNSVVNSTPANITYGNANTASLTVTPNSSSADGIYYYRCVVGVANCSSQNSSPASLTVNALPTATIAYTSSPYCLNAGTATVTRTGTGGGSYSAIPSGLSINPSTGNITLASSSAGTYTVTYSFSNGSTGCANTTTAQVTLNPLPVGVTALATPNPVCAGSAVALTSLPSATSAVTSQNFNTIGGWTRDNLSSGGTSSEVANAAWNLQNDGYNYGGTVFHSNDNSRFLLTNSDAQGPNINWTWTILTSPAFSTVGLSSCNLDFYHYYRARFFDAEASVQISTDNGANWTVLNDYVNSGTQGSASNFAHPSLNLNAYIGYPSVRIRFEYFSFDGWWWALDNITVTGGAIGAPFTYAWTSTPAGFTANTQNATVTPTVNTTYNVNVTNTYNCSVSASTPVTINPKPTATLNNSSSQTICSGSSANLSISFTGTAPWSVTYSNGSTSATVNNINSNPFLLTVNPNTTTTYTLTSLSASDANCGGGTASGSATVTVNPISIGGTVNGSTTVCVSSNSGTLNLTGQTGSIVQWEKSTDNGASWATVANTTASLSYSALTQTTQYRVLVKSGVCSSMYSSVAIITVNPASVGGSVNSSNSVCSGSSGTLTLSGYTGGITRWESSTNGGSTWTNIANTTTSQPYSNITQTTQYRAYIQSGNCSAAYSSVAIITVNPVTVPGTIANNSVCSGTSGSLSLTGFTGSIVQWEQSTDGGNNWTVCQTQLQRKLTPALHRLRNTKHW